MKRRTTAPFHQLSDSVAADRWTFELNHQDPRPVSDMMPDWEYGASLRVGRTLRLDAAAVARELGLEPGQFALSVMIEAGSGPGTYPRAIIFRAVEALPLDRPEYRFEYDLPCREMSAQLVLRTSIILADDIVSANPLAPARHGSRLWMDQVASRIEGDAARFPMEIMSFNAVFRGRPHQHAPWHLRWNPGDLDRDFYGAVRLYLNKDNELFIKRVIDQDDLTLQAVMGDVVSQMCESALRSPDGIEVLENADDSSLGGKIRRWLLSPFKSVQEARASLETRPGEFRAAILASTSFER